METYNRIFSRHTLALLFLFILAIIPRFLWLGTIPNGISNDEVNMIYNAKALFFTGAGLTGNTSPFIITPNYPKAELISVLISPIIGPLPFSLFNARMPFALLGVAYVLLLYAITKKLVGSHAAWLTGIVAATNPWNIFFTRTTYDAPITTFFLLLAFFMMFSFNGWKKMWSIIPLGIGLFVYLGMSMIFPFFILITTLFCWMNDKHKNMQPYLTILVLSALLFIQFFFILQRPGAGSRRNELFTPSSSSIAPIVNYQRRASVQNPMTNIYANKFVVYGTELFRKYLNAFSPNELFLIGDPKPIFSVHNHGLFYPTDLILIAAGAWFLFTYRRNVFWLLTALIAIAPIPAILSSLDTSYSSRAYLMQPALLIIAGCGLAQIIELAKRKKILYVTASLLVIITLTELVNYGYIYFLRNPIDNSESNAFSTHIMSYYAKAENSSGRTVRLLSTNPETGFKQYILYNNLFTKVNAADIARQYSPGKQMFQWNNFYSSVCPDETSLTTSTVITEGDNPCKTYTPKGSPMIIPILDDAGSVYKIYNGLTCDDMQLERFPHDIHFNDFKIDNLSTENLCKKFIIRY
jgi:4-amino-4-deoxy-L-arabinose transferase-like glycosyltransferase